MINTLVFQWKQEYVIGLGHTLSLVYKLMASSIILTSETKFLVSAQAGSTFSYKDDKELTTLRTFSKAHDR